MDDPKDDYSEISDLFDGETTVRDESLDETAIYEKLIDVKRNADLLRIINEHTEKVTEILSVVSNLIQAETQFQKLSQETFVELFKLNLDEEEVKRHNRLRSLIGLNILPDPRDEAAEKAMLGIQQARTAIREREEQILRQLDTTLEQLALDSAQLSELVEAALGSNNARMFEDIREQLRD